MRWWRGPYIPLAIVLVIVVLDYTTYRQTIAWKWPFAQWTMYHRPGSTEPEVGYRRFVLYRADGRREEVDLGEAFGFLGGPYRLDRGIDRSREAFIELCLRALRAKHGDDIVGLQHEERLWRYGVHDYAAHLREPPTNSFRVIAMDPPPAAMREGRPDGNLVRNGGFLKLRRRSGLPRDWELDGQWFGVGTPLGKRNQSLLLAAGPTPQAAIQVVTAPPGTRSVRLIALVRAEVDGAAIEVVATVPGAAPNVTRVDVRGAPAWQAVEVNADMPQGAEIRVVLRTSGAGDVYYDDVALYASGG